jgi:transposase
VSGVAESESSSTRVKRLEALLRRTQGQLAATSDQLAAVTTERDNLRRAYRQLMEQFELLRRRIFVAKAERVDATQLELEFEQTKQKLDELVAKLGASDVAVAGESDVNAEGEAAAQATRNDVGSRSAGKPPPKPQLKPKGRRNLTDADHLSQRRIEIRDPELDCTGTFIGWELSYKLGFQRPEPVRVVIARAKYKVTVPEAAVAEASTSETPVAVAAPSSEVVMVSTDEDGVPSVDAPSPEPAPARLTIVTAPLPRLLIRRGLLAPSMISRVIVQKFRFGMPFFRQEEQLEADGIALDRGTMARTVEDVGASLGPIVLATVDDTRKNAFCLSTDATGVAIRPEPLADGRRQPCRKGHFFVVLADKKHIFFEFQAKHSSAAVCEMFRGFSGYIQADAHAIYDALFRGDAVDDPTSAPIEVACWSHARRRFWEAAVCGFPVGREGLLRIRKLYQLDQSWAALPPSARLQKRQTVLRSLVDEFFDWVRAQNDLTCQERGVVNKALGYAVRQQLALRRFLDDARLRMDNNHSENALRVVASGRKAWLFFGSDDHAQAAANLYSLIAGCKLHGIDPERYLAEVIRVMPYWPPERYLELAPAYWVETRKRLDPAELAAELGHIAVPLAAASAPQQSAAS